MGLDITAYKNLKLTNIPSEVEDYDWEKYVVLYNNLAFNTFEELNEDYLYEHNAWRDLLEKFASALGTKNIFEKLINFSDCEGTIGPDTSALLAYDFVYYQNQAEAFAVKFH